ncbi:MAG: ATP/GTP-binding protein [Solirubrobacterales bacterium]|nr:ATP/GTP-binding protein [Solirubrobacterales bacterium]
MSESDRRDAVPLALFAAAVAIVLVAANAPRWSQSLLELAGHPAAVSLAVALLSFACAVLVARLVVTRRALDHRVAMLAVPADSFDPSAEAVLRFASGLSRSRRALRGLLDAPASAVRLSLDADPAGKLRYAVEVPEHARGALRAAMAAYHGVELRPAPAPIGEAGKAEVARAELVLARASSEPLRAAGLDPDPLSGFARTIDALDPAGGDTVAICVDLLPVTPGKRRRLRRRLLRRARRRQPSPPPGGELADLLGGGHRRRGSTSPAELVERWVGRQALTRKLGTAEPLFEMQVLIRVASPVPGRAKAQLAGLLAAWDAFAGENHLRVSGLRIPGVAFLGSDLPGRRRWFDRRLATGLFLPARRRVVTASEIAGLLKPPSKRCTSPNVLRSGGAVPPPPRGLPTFTGQAGLLPLGKVETEAGERMVGVPLRDTFFFYMSGRSRFGKTETAIGQFLHLARSGHGCLFLDPHLDALNRIKGYLTEEGLRERVVEVNLADPDRQPAWNLFAVARRSPRRAAGQVDAVVDAFASALRWDEVNARALNLTTQAAQALADLARRLPAELAPTIFEIPVLLSNEDWRAAVLPHVSAPVRQFFEERFPRLPPEAITPVTNLIDRLRAAPATAALLGNPLATYDIRAAMDRGQIVLVCPGSGSGRDRLIANFVVFDALHGAKSRADIPPERRREFYIWLDEVQIYDGASSGTLAALLEQVGKFAVKGLLLNQNPERLSAATRDAVTTNRSHLVTTALNAKGAGLLAREFGGEVTPETIGQLPRFHSLASVTLDGEISRPFRLAGVPVEELFPGECHPEDLSQLDTAIDRSIRRVSVAETLDRLDRHPEEIVKHLGARHRQRQGASGGRQTLDTRAVP